jgi:hypothetical protein
MGRSTQLALSERKAKRCELSKEAVVEVAPELLE